MCVWGGILYFYSYSFILLKGKCNILVSQAENCLMTFSVTDALPSTVLAPTEILLEFYLYPDPQWKLFPKYPIYSFLILVLCLKHILWFQGP